jgi:hypothetical protein
VKVLLVTNFPPDRQESMLRFGQLLAGGLPAHGIEPVVIAPESRLTRLLPTYRYSGWSKYLGYVDKFLFFPRRLRRAVRQHRPDVVHIIDHGNSAYAGAVEGRPVLATCHDLMQIRAARGEIPRHRPGLGGRLFQKWILHHLGRVPEVACVSGKTRDDLGRLAARPPGRTHLVYNGLNFPYAPVPAKEARARLRNLAPGDWSEAGPGY